MGKLVSDRTPTTQEVRIAVMGLGSVWALTSEEFDRWLARYRQSVIHEVEDHLVRRVGYASDVVDELREKND